MKGKEIKGKEIKGKKFLIHYNKPNIITAIIGTLVII